MNETRRINSTRRGRTSNSTSGTIAVDGTSGHSAPNPRPSRHREKFNAALTDPSSANSASPSFPRASCKHRNPRGPENDDLTSTLIYSLRTPPYPDCPICFVPIHPVQPTWSCSSSIPISSAADTDDKVDGTPLRRKNDNGQCCWTTFHVKCIREWARKSVKEIEDAWRARGKTGKANGGVLDVRRSGRTSRVVTGALSSQCLFGPRTYSFTWQVFLRFDS
jgi:transcriptional repressor NF-X1